MPSVTDGQGKGITAEELQFIWNFISNEIIEERKRQDAIPYNMLMAMLAEKVGRVAYCHREGQDEYLRQRLIETAALCVRWVEHLRREVPLNQVIEEYNKFYRVSNDGLMDNKKQ